MSTDPTLLRDVRRNIAGWLRNGGASDEDVEVAQIACHEACSNAIEHGYGFRDGTFTIDGRLENGKVVLEVADRGHWIDRPDGGLPHRGRGIALIESLMDKVQLTHDGDAMRAHDEMMDDCVLNVGTQAFCEDALEPDQ